MYLSQIVKEQMAKYIYEYDDWPDFTWDEKQINVLLGKVRHLQGRVYEACVWKKS